MARAIKHIEDQIVNSIIGEGSEFKGEFKINGLLRIDGKFRGTINTDGKVLIGQKGEAITDIKAKMVIVGGIVRGNIYATERVILLSTGQIEGNIITNGLIMEDGVVFNGNCTINKRIEERKLQMTETEIEQYKNELTFQIKEAYYNHCKAIQYFDLIQETKKLVNENYRVTQKLLDNNMINKDAVLRAKYEISKIELYETEAIKNMSVEDIEKELNSLNA